MKIQEKYEHACNHPSDINEHVSVLKSYADKVSHITEMGVRECVATYGFLASALQSPKKIISIDLYTTEGVKEAVDLCKEEGLDFTFIQADVLKIEIEPTELLFIDTFHCYSQLRQELELHGNKASKYLIFHDSQSYAHTDENGFWLTPEMIANYKDEGKKGLIPAINEFLEANPHWVLDHHYTNNNGLMVLKRNG